MVRQKCLKVAGNVVKSRNDGRLVGRSDGRTAGLGVLVKEPVRVMVVGVDGIRNHEVLLSRLCFRCTAVQLVQPLPVERQVPGSSPVRVAFLEHSKVRLTATATGTS